MTEYIVLVEPAGRMAGCPSVLHDTNFDIGQYAQTLTLDITHTL